MKKYCILGGKMQSQVDLAIHLATFFSNQSQVLLLNLKRGDYLLRGFYEIEDMIYDLDDYILDQCTLEQCIVEVEEKKIFCIPSSYKQDKNKLAGKDFVKLKALDYSIQICIGAEKEEAEWMKIWATDIIYLECPKKEEDKNIFVFGKKDSKIGFYLGKYPDQEQGEKYWETLGLALLQGKDMSTNNFWEKIKGLFIS